MATTHSSSYKFDTKLNDNDKSELNFALQMPPVPEKPLRYGKSTNGNIQPNNKLNVTNGIKDIRNENYHQPSPPPPQSSSTNQTCDDRINDHETDEVDFLLEEIKDIEIPTCRTDSDEHENFDIAGSQADLDLSLHLDSAIDTSWYYFSISVHQYL